MATLTVPNKETEAKPERMVRVKLLHDVWVDKINPDTGENETVRLRTNTPILDENGMPMVDKKSKAPITKIQEHELPVSLAQKLVDMDKAKAIITL